MGIIQRDLEERTSNKADEIAEQRYGREFYELPKPLQFEVWCEAESIVRDKVADQADAIYDRKREDDLLARENGHNEIANGNEPIMTCPNCGAKLEHFSGLEHIPEHSYCPKCVDKAYNEDGEFIFLLE